MTLEVALALIAERQAQNALVQQGDALQEENRLLRAENAGLREQVAALEARIAQLEAGSPPSTPPWVKANRPTQAQEARPARRQRPADQNHGRPREEPTACVQHAYGQCPDCGYALRGQAVARRREVLELPVVQVAVVEHQFLKRSCPVCAAYKTPPAACGGVVRGGHSRIGVRLARLIGVLRTTSRLPLAQIQALLAAVYGLHRSLGGLQEILARLRRHVAPVHAQVVAQTRASPVLQRDETGWRQDGQNGYLWVQATDGPMPTRCYTVDRSRSGQVARTLLDGLGGVLSTDFYAAYDQYAGPKHRCWAHLLRDAHKLGEAYPDQAEVHAWVDALNGLFAGAQALDLSRCTLPQRAAGVCAAGAGARDMLPHDGGPSVPGVGAAVASL